MKPFKPTGLPPGRGRRDPASPGALPSAAPYQSIDAHQCSLGCQPHTGHPGGTARRDLGLWGRCLTPGTVVSDEGTKQRGAPDAASCPASVVSGTSSTRAPSWCFTGQPLAPPGRHGVGMGGLSRVPALLQLGDGPGRWRASHPWVHPCKCTHAPTCTAAANIPSCQHQPDPDPLPCAYHTPRSLLQHTRGCLGIPLLLIPALTKHIPRSHQHTSHMVQSLGELLHPQHMPEAAQLSFQGEG